MDNLQQQQQQQKFTPAVERRIKFAEWKQRRKSNNADNEEDVLRRKLAIQITSKHKLSQELKRVQDELFSMRNEMNVLKAELEEERKGKMFSVAELRQERRDVSNKLLRLSNENGILQKTNEIMIRRLSEESVRKSEEALEIEKLYEDEEQEENNTYKFRYESLRIDHEELKHRHNIVRTEKDLLNVRLEKLLLRRFGASMVSWMQRTRDKRVRRTILFRELLESERLFERDLKLMREHFFEPLRRKRDYVTLANDVFGVLDAVMFVSQKIQEHLNRAVENNNENDILEVVSTLFSEHGVIFKAASRAYSDYYVNYKVMSRHLRNVRREDDSLNAFFLSKQNNVPEMEGRDVDSLIVLPVQRLPRYGILLKQIKKLTPEHSPWSSKLQIALSQLLRLLDFCDAALDRRRRQSFHDKFGALNLDVDGSNPKTKPRKRERRKSDVRNVRLLLSGTLLKFGQFKWNERVCWIFEDAFVYTEDSKIKGTVSLSGAVVKVWSSKHVDMKLSKRFDIFASNGTKLSFETSSVPEREIWVRVLNRAIMVQDALRPIQTAILKSGTMMKKDLITGEWSRRDCKLSTAGLVFTRTATEIAHSLGIIEARDILCVRRISHRATTTTTTDKSEEEDEMIIIFSYDSRERFHSINLASHFECLDLDGWNENNTSGKIIRDIFHFDHDQESKGMISATMPIVLSHLKDKSKLCEGIKIGFYRFKGADVSEWIRLISEIIDYTSDNIIKINK